MGLENRDYYRDDGSAGQTGGVMSDTPVCRNIIFITIAVYLAQIFLTREPTIDDVRELIDRSPSAGTVEGTMWDGPEGIEESGLSEEEIEELIRQTLPRISIVESWLELDTDKVLHGQVWRLLTACFCHARLSFWHILINMLLLFWFGRTLESIYGSREFLFFYLVAAVIASLAFIGLQLLTNERVPGFGASGAVMAVVCVFTMMYPRHTIMLFFIIPVEMRFLLAIYVIYDVHPVLLQLAGTPVPTGVGHAAHLGGLVFGFLYWKYQWRVSPFFTQLGSLFKRGSGPRRKLKIHQAPDDQLSDEDYSDRFDQQVDALLDKISRDGEESLTDKERKILTQASKRYRGRQD